MKEILSVENLSYCYPQASAASLQDITLKINQGEFVLLLGMSGSGKSTFLRAMNGLIPRFYGGTIAGHVYLFQQNLTSLSQRQIVSSIGFLQQDPERQLLLQTVERELVFGLENLAVSAADMKSRLAEISQLFGLGAQIEKKTAELSGGEKQRIALASILAPYPGLLLLDEPTSQLDPVHAEEVLQTVRRLNEEWGITVLMSEHRVERCFHLADRILLFESGKVTFDGTPKEFVDTARTQVERQSFLPPVTRQFMGLGIAGELPLTVKAARASMQALDRLNEPVSGKERASKALLDSDHIKPAIYNLSLVSAGYPGNEEVICSLSLSIRKGDRIALLGENGAGKSTFAKLLCGAVQIRKGELKWKEQLVDHAFWNDSWRRIGYLSQNPNDYFLHDEVETELEFALQQLSLSKEEKEERKEELLTRLGLLPYRKRHPHDVSGGEKQRLALALILPARPELLILDEPTRGLDAEQKNALIDLLEEMEIPTTMIITHDVEFASAFANRVLIMHRGELVADGVPDQVFRQSFAYMPQDYKLNRQTGHT